MGGGTDGEVRDHASPTVTVTSSMERLRSSTSALVRKEEVVLAVDVDRLIRYLIHIVEVSDV